jgi:hypothetical protein
MFLMFHHPAAPFGAPPAVLGVVIDQRNDFFASGFWHSPPTLNFQLLTAGISSRNCRTMSTCKNLARNSSRMSTCDLNGLKYL